MLSSHNMKVVRLYKFSDIRVEEEPVPEISDQEVLVRTVACGVCTGEVMPWYIEQKAPLVLGHEPAGVVVKAGKGVKTLKEGDRVFIHHHGPCMECSFCQRGDYVQCYRWRHKTIEPGGMAEYIRVKKEGLVDTLKLPQELGFEEATLVEPLGCVVKSLSRAGLRHSDTLLVIGLGVMGLLHVMLSRHYGAGRVIGADMVRFRLETALRAGADHVIDVSTEDLIDACKRFTSGKGPEMVIVGPGSIQAIEAALEAVSPGGTVVLFTPVPPQEQLVLDVNYIYFKDINIVTSYSCGPEDTRKALEHLKRGHIDTELVITHRFPIDRAPEAYQLVSEAKDSLKVLVVFPKE